jgi:tetratricopeptide (TPR) repeat protein
MAWSAVRNSILLLAFAAMGCREVGARRDIQEGNKLYYASKYEQAVAKYREALAVQPDLAIGWFNLGLAYLANFAPGLKTEANEVHAKGAIECFEKYIAMVPTDVQAQDYLLGVYIDSGRYEGAIRFFEVKLEKNPADIESVAQLASISAQAAKYDDAIKWHKKKAEMVTTNDLKADSWYSIGVLDWRRLNGHPDVMGAERARIADEGLAWLVQADKVRQHHSPTLSYLNLLYRERATAHGASYARAVDTTSAQVYYKLATEAAKKQ